MNSTTKNDLESEKRLVAHTAVRWVENGMRLGLGSGSTARYLIRLLGQRISRDKLRVKAVASSKESASLAKKLGIPVFEPVRGVHLDLTIDGADEIGPGLSLIKGGGGALLREKVVARTSRYFLVLGDSSKHVEHLGRFPLPIEVVPFSLPWVLDEIEALGAKPVLRMNAKRMNAKSKRQPFRTDQRNYIVDCHFGRIKEPDPLASRLEKIPGIVEHGLFLNYATSALIARGSKLVVLFHDGSSRSAEDFKSLP